jgi:hypothetical protein
MSSSILIDNRYGSATVVSAGPIARSTLTGRKALRRMAEDLRSLVVTADSVTADDLQLLGWTQAQINALGSKARVRAIEASVR